MAKRAKDQRPSRGFQPLTIHLLVLGVVAALSLLALSLVLGQDGPVESAPPAVGFVQEDQRLAVAASSFGLGLAWTDLLVQYGGDETCRLYSPAGDYIASGQSAGKGFVLAGDALSLTARPGALCSVEVTYRPGGFTMGEWTYQM